MGFEIDTSQEVYTRKRYNFWMLLGDVGGLHDGLLLLINLIMASISAASFSNALTGNAYQLDRESEHGNSREERVRLA